MYDIDHKSDFYMTMVLVANWQQTLLFVGSWIVFYIVGRLFLDNGIGQYHSSHLKNWVAICKALFLSTFVIACTLLELLTFELLDVINPIIRQFIWTTSFGALCVILNILIPGVLAATICVHFDVPYWCTCLVSCLNLTIFHCVTIAMRVILPMHHSTEEYLFHQQSLFKYMLSHFFSFNIQISISLIAIVGTIIAAIIAAFATVSFPMEQLFIPRQIDPETLESREAFVQSVIKTIVKKQKSLLLLRQRNDSTIPQLQDQTKTFKNASEVTQSTCAVVDGSTTIASGQNSSLITCSSLTSFDSNCDIPGIAFSTAQCSIVSSNTISPPINSTGGGYMQRKMANQMSVVDVSPFAPLPATPVPCSPTNGISLSPPMDSSGSLSPVFSINPMIDTRSGIDANLAWPEGQVSHGRVQYRGYSASTKQPAMITNAAITSSKPIQDLASVKYAGISSHHSHPELSSMNDLQHEYEHDHINRAFGKECCRLAYETIKTLTTMLIELGYMMIGIYKWMKFGCSLNVAIRNIRSALVTSFIRTRLGLSGCYYFVRSYYFGIRSKPRHAAPCKLSRQGNNYCEDWKLLIFRYSRELTQFLTTVSSVCCQRVNDTVVYCWNCWRMSTEFVPYPLNYDIREHSWCRITLDNVQRALQWVGFRRTPRNDGTGQQQDEEELFLVPNAEWRFQNKLQGETALLQKEISGLQLLCEDLFLELVTMRESTDKAVMSSTWWGYALRISGQFLTILGIFRFLFGLWRVGLYLSAGSFVSVSQQSDNVSAFLSFIFLYLRVDIDLDPWSPILGTAYVGCMGLLHIRAFIISTEQFAKLGVLSTSTEIYSLVLAYMAGSYAIAGVLFLRSQLPTYRRVGVTAALGENIVLDFYFWLNDVVFIVATICSCVYFWKEIRKTQRLHDVAAKAKYSREDVNCNLFGCVERRCNSYSAVV